MCLLLQSEWLTAEYLFVCLHFICYDSAVWIWIEAGTILITREKRKNQGKEQKRKSRLSIVQKEK